MNRSTFLFVLLALGVGFTLFKVKYEVVDLEQRLNQTKRQIERERENIHILKAEWSHLNEPQRLKRLADKYLDIFPMKTEQVAAIFGAPKSPGNFTHDHSGAQLANLKGAE